MTTEAWANSIVGRYYIITKNHKKAMQCAITECVAVIAEVQIVAHYNDAISKDRIKRHHDVINYLKEKLSK